MEVEILISEVGKWIILNEFICVTRLKGSCHPTPPPPPALKKIILENTFLEI